MVGFICWDGSLLTHVQFVVHQDSQILFCRAAFQPAQLHVDFPPQKQDFAFAFVELQEIYTSPFPACLCLLCLLQHTNRSPGWVISANIMGEWSIPASRSLTKILNSIDLRCATSSCQNRWYQDAQSICPGVLQPATPASTLLVLAVEAGLTLTVW